MNKRGGDKYKVNVIDVKYLYMGAVWHHIACFAVFQQIFKSLGIKALGLECSSYTSQHDPPKLMYEHCAKLWKFIAYLIQKFEIYVNSYRKSLVDRYDNLKYT